ncbi:MAG: hypothetical protein MUC95_06100, partial [Spirochaetes bacterium]|nr:hypothetical protein [Spirochaetota bacterium]
MLKKIKHIKPPLLVALSVIIIFCLSCERNDLFTQARVETTDIINPVPGNSGIITAPDINITTNSLMLEWTPAEDNRTAQADLEYRAYRSVTGNINTLFNAQN